MGENWRSSGGWTCPGKNGVLSKAYDKHALGRDKGGKVCRWLPTVSGIRSRAYQLGIILDADVVYDTDVFRYVKGDSPRIDHERTFGNSDKKVIAAYAIFRRLQTNDSPEYIICRRAVDVSYIEMVRKMSDLPNGGPWKNHYEEMAIKTAIRYAIKTAPVSDAIVKVASREDQYNSIEAEKREMEFSASVSTPKITSEDASSVNLPSPPPEANGSAKSAARGRPKKATGHARVIIDAIGACSTQGDLEAVKHGMLSPRIAAYKNLSEVDKTECCIVYSAKSMELAEDLDSVEKSFAFACGRKEFGSLELKKRMYVCHIYYMAMLRVLNDIESIGNVYVTAKGSDWDSFTHKQKNAIEDLYALRIAEIQESTAFESQKHSLLKALRRDEGQAINA